MGGFARVNFAGRLDADNTCKLNHTQQSGWTKCRFRRAHGDEWSVQCEWNMANLTGWYGTHELRFSGDTRTTPGACPSSDGRDGRDITDGRVLVVGGDGE